MPIMWLQISWNLERLLPASATKFQTTAFQTTSEINGFKCLHCLCLIKREKMPQKLYSWKTKHTSTTLSCF